MEKQLLNILAEFLTSCLGSSVQIGRVRPLGGGSINQVWLLVTQDGEFVVKWNANCPSDFFEREIDGLSALRQAKSGLVIPECLGCRASEGGMPAWLMMRYLPPSIDQGQQAEKLGEGLAMLHRHQAQMFGFPSSNYCGITPQPNDHTTDWVVFYRDCRLGHMLSLLKKTNAYSSFEFSVFDRLLSRLPEWIGHEPAPSLVHGDLWSGNVLATDQGPALIDPACSFSDREFEFGILLMFGGFSPRFWEAYHSIFPLDPEWESRNHLYQLYHYLNHYYLFGGSYGAEALRIAQYFAGRKHSNI